MYSLFLQLPAAVPNADEAYKLLGASYADWLMALGGLATFGTLIYLLVSSKGQQESINAISTSLTELTKHSAELTKQSQEMSVRNQLQTQLNNLMGEQVAIMRQMHQAGEVTNEAHKRMIQLEEEKRRIELEPAFAYTSALGDANTKALGINVTNFGKGVAIVNSLVVQQGGRYFQLAHNQFPLQLGPGAGFTIAGVWNNVSYERLSFTLAMRYTDVLQNEYEVIIDNSPKGLDIKAPTLITRANNLISTL
ncbi:hypothetical protein [Hymenobacter antarcticus]|uniref:Uncharacterized protein n=1 Tax=Hymenobacter antarcticus TaxID=486270 RepID=A0ABP7QRH9_9BACT